MSVTLRRSSIRVLACLAVLVVVSASAQAQTRQPVFGGRAPRPFIANTTPFNPNPFVAPGLTLQQAAFNTAVVGRSLAQIPPYWLGYNPIPFATGPAFPPLGSPVVNTLGAAYASPIVGPGVGPSYVNTPFGATLATDPYGASTGYSLSTTGGGGGIAGSTYNNPWVGGGYSGTTPAQGFLYGAAALTSATGEFHKNIMQAKLMREEVKRSQIDTARARARWELEYEAMRPGLQDYREKQAALDLRIARGDAPLGSVLSGRALNDLLKAINAPGRSLNRGPTIPLEEDMVKSLTLTAPGSAGNIGLLKDGGKLTWPLSLQDERFKEAREKLSDQLRVAVGQLTDGRALRPATVTDLESYLKSLNDTLGAAAEELSPSQYIEARQYLNKVRDAVSALRNPKAANYFNNTWTAKGRNVAEVVEHMRGQGLQFAPAGPGEEGAYAAMYLFLRAFENGLQTASR